VVEVGFYSIGCLFENDRIGSTRNRVLALFSASGPFPVFTEERQDRTGWLGLEDSNSQMSFPKLAFEVWPEFPFSSERLAIRDFSRLSCQRVTCTPVESILSRGDQGSKRKRVLVRPQRSEARPSCVRKGRSHLVASRRGIDFGWVGHGYCTLGALRILEAEAGSGGATEP
jgi:hypothetical protein